MLLFIILDLLEGIKKFLTNNIKFPTIGTMAVSFIRNLFDTYMSQNNTNNNYATYSIRIQDDCGIKGQLTEITQELPPELEDETLPEEGHRTINEMINDIDAEIQDFEDED